MKSTSKKAFIMENCNSPYIAQAIFILKEGADAQSARVIKDAERIVAAYMGQSCGNYNKKEKKHTWMFFTLCVSVSCAAMLIVLKLLNY